MDDNILKSKSNAAPDEGCDGGFQDRLPPPEQRPQESLHTLIHVHAPIYHLLWVKSSFFRSLPEPKSGQQRKKNPWDPLLAGLASSHQAQDPADF